jgi:tetratricopeptide (TPR) repeat protein
LCVYCKFVCRTSSTRIGFPEHTIFYPAAPARYALEYFRGGRYEEAEAAYATILEHEPGHFICLYHLGLIAHTRGNHTAAARLIEQAISIKPDYIEALSNLAAIHRARGQ